MTRVLITGGLGFVGGRLAQLLAEDDSNRLTLATRRDVRSVDWLPQARIARVNWEVPESLDALCAQAEVVVHAAGLNAAESAQRPAAALEVNGAITAKLVTAACSNGVRRFVYISTAHVYASPLQGDIDEATRPESTHPYATSHRAGEDAVRAAHSAGDIDGVVVRLSNAFGRPASKDVDCWSLLVNDLCRQAVVDRRLALKSSGRQRRDFIPMTEACRAIEHLMHVSATDLGDGLFNVGGEWSPTVLEIAEIIAARCDAVLGFRPPVTTGAVDAGENVTLHFNTRALRRSGFETRVKPDEEIDDLLRFCHLAFR